MKKLFLLLVVTLTTFPSFSQEENPQQWFFRSRILQVDQSNVAEFEKAVAKKTQMFNNSEDQPRWVTFRILSGPQANNYVRMQLTNDISDFDNEDLKGNAYYTKIHEQLSKKYGVEQVTVAQLGGKECGKCHY